MSEAVYNSMQRKWNEYLDEEFYPQDATYTPDEASEEYDQLAHSFCKENDYSEKTEEFAFHGQWYDTFADMYYLKLEKHGAEILRTSNKTGEEK